MAALFSYLTGGKRERRGRDESASEAQPTLNSNRSVWCVLSVFHCVDAAGSLNTCCKTHTIPLIWAGVTGDGAVICVLTRSELDYKNWEAWFSEVFRCESFDSQRDFWQNVGTDGHHCVFASGFTRCGGAKQGRSDKVNKCLKKSLSWKIMLFDSLQLLTFLSILPNVNLVFFVVVEHIMNWGSLASSFCYLDVTRRKEHCSNLRNSLLQSNCAVRY